MTTISRAERLSGSWLAVARIALLVLAALTVGLYLVSVPLKLAELRQVCVAPAPCGGMLNPAQATRLLAAGLSLDFYAGYFVGTRLVLSLVHWGIALLILWRRPSEGMALLTALLLVILPTLGAGILNSLPPAFPALWFPVQLVQYAAWMTFPIFFLLFPNGHWVPRLRYAGWLLAVWFVAFIPGSFFPNSPLVSVIESFAGIAFPAMFLLSLLAQIYRYRRVSTALERQQTKWVLYGASLLLGGASAGAQALTLLVPAISLSPPLAPADLAADAVLNGLLQLLLPVTLGVSILRFRLFEIDVLIRRTLIYAVLTALLALAYFGTVLGLQGLIGTLTGQRQSTVVTVLSTLVIAALFVPLRARVQAVIDRRFYRRKYDAARTLTAFGAALREEVELAHLAGQLVEIVQESMQPAHVSLWLKPSADRVHTPGERLI